MPLRTTWPGLSRDVWTVQAGTAVSSRVRGGVPNSVNFIHSDTTTGARQCRLERWDYAAREQRFVHHSSQVLGLSGTPPRA